MTPAEFNALTAPGRVKQNGYVDNSTLIAEWTPEGYITTWNNPGGFNTPKSRLPDVPGKTWVWNHVYRKWTLI